MTGSVITLQPRSVKPRPELLELLERCHGRMRQLSSTAVRIAESQGAPPEEIADAARSVHRYFTMAFPLHGEDEERSLLPRLSGLDPALDATLARLEPEHRVLDAAVAEVVRLCDRLRAEPAALDAVRAELLSAATALVAKLSEHLAEEERSFFPAIERHLVPQHGAAILAEIRARRQSGEQP